jgi:hypothetical protein
MVQTQERTMKTFQAVSSLLLLSAIFITPANANWFSSQSSNTMFNVGSVRNPTPAELRALYAKDGAERRPVAPSLRGMQLPHRP